MLSPDQLLKLRVGCKVKLRAPENPVDNKPLPLGWQEVADHNGQASVQRPAAIIKVVSDSRWLPVALIEEIVL